MGLGAFWLFDPRPPPEHFVLGPTSANVGLENLPISDNAPCKNLVQTYWHFSSYGKPQVEDLELLRVLESLSHSVLHNCSNGRIHKVVVVLFRQTAR